MEKVGIDPSDLTAEQQAIYDTSEAWSCAVVANDADAIASFMDDQWIMVSERGVATKEHFLSFVRSGQLTHSAMDLAEVGRITVLGDIAVMAARVTNTAHFAGQTYEANEWTSDVFRLTASGWKCIVTHITPALEAPSLPN